MWKTIAKFSTFEITAWSSNIIGHWILGIKINGWIDRNYVIHENVGRFVISLNSSPGFEGKIWNKGNQQFCVYFRYKDSLPEPSEQKKVLECYISTSRLERRSGKKILHDLQGTRNFVKILQARLPSSGTNLQLHRMRRKVPIGRGIQTSPRKNTWIRLQLLQVQRLDHDRRIQQKSSLWMLQKTVQPWCRAHPDDLGGHEL